ncbi:protein DETOXIFICATION 1-like isoform X2 [Momordica charantia]|uniref:Protein DETOXIFICATION n=1 Tax=Momordica charantia TaxID=3673 RepID=A0A6J1CLS8_MOMCH|nr:protein DETOXIFICATION 1-like isoform X2 [Momordica charantia]
MESERSLWWSINAIYFNLILFKFSLEPKESRGEKKMREKWRVYPTELKKVSLIAAPITTALVLQYLLQVVTVVIVGHLGDELLLSGVSIATSFVRVTGFSLLLGMAGALETLCGQAYGAEQYQKLGVYTYSCMISLILVCFPISVLWFFTDKLLISIGQDPSISSVARKYSVFLIPNLFACAILQSLLRYFLTQSLILPLLFSSFATLCLHIPICWLFVFHFKLRVVGAALALGISYWLNVILLASYVFFSPSCNKTRAPLSREAISSIGQFFRLAVPSAVMVCLEWWSYEVILLLSGLLPNPKVEASVLSICFSITYLHYFIPYGLGATVSTRVSNELGAGNPEAAKVAVKVVGALGIIESITVSVILFGCRNILGYAFTNDTQIADHIASMWPLICLSILIDTFLGILSGVARGTGWQQLGAYVNLGSYYIVGIPMAAVLAFVAHLRVKGLWIGLVSGATIQSLLFALITIFTNWHKQALIARERVLEGNT